MSPDDPHVASSPRVPVGRSPSPRSLPDCSSRTAQFRVGARPARHRGPRPKTTQPPAAAATPTATPDADAGEAGARRPRSSTRRPRSRPRAAEKRHEAFEKAKAAGKTGQQRPTGAGAAAPAAGWAGELPIDTQWDDWEPAIAADPHARVVYMIATRYAAPSRAPATAPSPWMALEVSPDGGATWGAGDAAVRLQGQGPVRPDHRGRPATPATSTRST